MNQPSFFIVGHSKSGTSALYKFLDAHPSIFMCSPKEPNFFAKDFCRGITRGAYTERTEAEYLELFEAAAPDQACGEASACYLYSQVAAEEIYAFNSEGRILIMLREPVSFLHSYHLQRLRNPATEGEDVLDFETALSLEDERKAGRHIPPECLTPRHLFYSERIRYREQVERFMRLFGPEQTRVIIYDDFRADNEGVFRDVLTFLGVDATFTPVFREHNKGVRLRHKRLQNVVDTLTRGEGAWRRARNLAKNVFPPSFRRAVVGTAYRRLVFAPKPTVDPRLMRRLKAQFKPEVVKISDYLGRDLVTLWGYDAV